MKSHNLYGLKNRGLLKFWEKEPLPRLSAALIEARAKVVDVGARGGAIKELIPFAPFIHYVAIEPEQKAFIIGSPFFDKWFEADGLLEDRGTFCRRPGLDPAKPFFVYLGSSAKIARDETWLVQNIYNGLKTHSKTSVQNLSMLVRPYPANAKGYNKLEGDHLVVWPKDGALPEARDSQRDFYNALWHCEFTIGINTSGMIDAIIHGKPCLTVMTDQYRSTQEKAVHFRQLLHAEVLDVNHSTQEVMDSIDRLLAGEDRHSDQRLQFVKEFVRPRGLELAAGEVAARAIALIAKGRSVDELKVSME